MGVGVGVGVDERSVTTLCTHSSNLSNLSMHSTHTGARPHDTIRYGTTPSQQGTTQPDTRQHSIQT